MAIFWESNPMSIIPKRQFSFENLGSGTDSFTLADDETGFYIEADGGSGYISFFGTATDNNGLALNKDNQPQRFDVYPGITVNIAGKSASTEMNVLTFKTAKGGI